jgi:hypothetical protein
MAIYRNSGFAHCREPAQSQPVLPTKARIVAILVEHHVLPTLVESSHKYRAFFKNWAISHK